jgi:hypothetical protein
LLILGLLIVANGILTTAVSAAVRIPFATMRSPRISNSFAAFGM